MKPVKYTRSRFVWNGGRNSWASFLLGFGWVPRSKKSGWCLHIYLGLWVWTIDRLN